MIPDFLKEVIDKCKIARFEEVGENTLKFSQKETKDLPLEVNHFYKIEIANYIINEPPNFTLSVNWNRGTKPPETVLNAEVEQLNGKMVKLLCVGTTTGIQWEGWIPQKAIEILDTIE